MPESTSKVKTKPSSRLRGRPPNPELRAQKHQRMLESAYTLFVKNGYDVVTVEQIAGTSGQSKGAFYWYFKDKEDCLTQVLIGKGKILFTDLAKIIESDGTAAERLLALTDFNNWCSPEYQQFIILRNGLIYSASKSVRDLANEYWSTWWNDGYLMVKKLAKEAAKETGWSDQELSEYDFDTWAFCYLSSYNGVYDFLDRKYVPNSGGVENIAKAIHKAFVFPIIRKT